MLVSEQVPYIPNPVELMLSTRFLDSFVKEKSQWIGPNLCKSHWRLPD